MSHAHAKIDIDRLSASQAKEITVYYLIDGKVYDISLYEFIMLSRRANKDGLPLIEANGIHSVLNIPKGTSSAFGKSRRVPFFKWNTPEDAETGVMRFIYSSDFLTDRTRDTRYFYSAKTASEIAWLEAGQPTVK